MRVLLISDRMLVEMGMRMVLNPDAHGIELIWRVSSSMGLAEIVKPEPLDMIVIDLDMEGARRLGLAKRVLDLPHWAVVVTLTAMPSDEEEARARALGVNAYLRKDIPKNELDDVLRGLLKPGKPA